MSKLNLSTYFECERPGKYDMCVIVRGILLAEKNKHKVCFHMEHIWYDSDEKKVYFEMRDKEEEISNMRLNELMALLKKQCRYAGEGTYELMTSLYRYYSNGDYDSCMELADYYMAVFNNRENERRLWLIISMICVAISEAIYLNILNIQYY